MADSFLAYQNPTATDKKLDSETLTVGANTVERERIQIAGAAATDIAPVSATTGLYADVRAVPTDPFGANADAASATGSISAKLKFLTTTGVAITSAVVTTVNQLAGQNISMNTGVRDAGTQRVTIATNDVVPASQSGTWNIGTVTTLTTCSTVTNLSQLGGQAISMGTGVRAAGTQRVTIATDDIVPASQSGTWTVQPGNTANSTPWLTTDTPATSGGLTMTKLVSAATTNATNVKASAGQVFYIGAFNINAAVRYLKLYNKATAPTVGSDTPVQVYAIPGNTAGAGVVFNIDKGLAFSLGIGFALTTGITDADATAVAASEILVNIGYK